MARGGPRKVCWPPTWLDISLMTSASRFVLSSTKSATKNDGITMSRARPQMTISFIPIDRDLFHNCAPDNDTVRSFIVRTPCCKVLCIAKLYGKKILGARAGKASYQPQCLFILTCVSCIPDHLLQRGNIFNEAFTSYGCYS